MKASINGLEVPFKDLGEPTVTFEGEEYNIIQDQTGEPYIQVGTTTAYIEFQDDEGNLVAFGSEELDEKEDEPQDEISEPEAEPAEAPAVKPTEPKPAKPEVKDPMMLAIEAMLNQRAQEDELFAVTLTKPNKSLKDCVDYIYAEVKRIGRQGYADAEILGMAVHYYDEDSIKPGSVQKPSKVIVNTPMEAPKPVELTTEQKEEARKLAVDNAIKKEADRLAAKKKSVKPVVETQGQQSLF